MMVILLLNSFFILDIFGCYYNVFEKFELFFDFLKKFERARRVKFFDKAAFET